MPLIVFGLLTRNPRLGKEQSLRDAEGGGDVESVAAVGEGREAEVVEGEKVLR